jgi:hypothetical protein
MCRPFGLSSAPLRTRPTFWLLDAPDSLSRRSRQDPDGTGLGYACRPRVGCPLSAVGRPGPA